MKQIFFIFIIFFMFIHKVWADTLIGPANISGDIKKDLSIFVGPAQIIDANIEGTLSAKGRVCAKHSKANAMKIIGSVVAKDVETKLFEVKGTLKLDKAVINNLSVIGGVDAKHLEAINIDIRGSTKIEDVKVNSANITGRVKAKHLEARNLQVKGATTIKDDTNIKKLQIVGNLLIEKSKIDQLEITSNYCTIKDSMVNNVHFLDSKSSEPEHLYLYGQIDIKESIVFDSGKGIVHVSKDYKDTNSLKVKGGRIVLDAS